MPKKTQRFDPRQTMNRENYEVFHYLDTEMSHLDAHYHDFYEIYLFLDGEVDYWLNGSLYHLKTGDILLIHPTELHKVIPLTGNKNYERIVLWIDKNYLHGIESGIFEGCFRTAGPKLLRPSSSDRAQMIALAQNLVKEYYSEAFGNKSYAFGILLQFLTLVNRLAQTEKLPKKEEYSTPTFIAQVLSYVGEHYAEELSLDKLSAHFFISKYYLSHEFKKAVGTSLHRYITLKRLAASYDLLQSGTDPSKVYLSCGFNDYTNFYKAFRAEYKVNPSAVAQR